jgi:hypothetical protein
MFLIVLKGIHDELVLHLSGVVDAEADRFAGLEIKLSWLEEHLAITGLAHRDPDCPACLIRGGGPADLHHVGVAMPRHMPVVMAVPAIMGACGHGRAATEKDRDCEGCQFHGDTPLFVSGSQPLLGVSLVRALSLRVKSGSSPVHSQASVPGGFSYQPGLSIPRACGHRFHEHVATDSMMM